MSDEGWRTALEMAPLLHAPRPVAGLTLDVEGCWRSWFKVDPLMQVFSPVPSRLPPWPRQTMFFWPGVGVPSPAHYDELVALNPGLRLIEWGTL